MFVNGKLNYKLANVLFQGVAGIMRFSVHGINKTDCREGVTSFQGEESVIEEFLSINHRVLIDQSVTMVILPSAGRSIVYHNLKRSGLAA